MRYLLSVVVAVGLMGCEGSKGDTGEQGPKGDTGEQGPPGEDTGGVKYIARFNDEDEISLAVVFSDEIVSTPVITVSGQATATVTAAGNTDWSYTRDLGTAESNNALLAILIDANSGTPATSVLDVAGNCLAGDYTTAPTDQLYYDRTHPTIGTLTIASNNGNNTALAKPADVVTLSMTGSENLHASPTMTVEGTAATVTQGANATLWAGTVPMSEAAHTDDTAVEVTADCYDKSGNSCTQVTATTDGSAVDACFMH